MMTYSNIVFSAAALLDGNRPAHRVQEALLWLQARQVKLAVIGSPEDGVWQAALHQGGLGSAFEGRVFDETSIAPSTHLSVYWDVIKSSGMAPASTMAIVSDLRTLRLARNGGIGTVVGYAGSLSVDFGAVANHEEGMIRSGAHATMTSYVQLPELHKSLRPHQSAPWHYIAS